MEKRDELVYDLARVIHESAKRVIAANKAIAKIPGPFIEWKDLTEDQKQGKKMMAEEVVEVLFPKQITNDFSFITKDFVVAIGSSVLFKIQDGPIKEQGINGCQVDDMIDVAARIVSFFDDIYPCKENKETLRHLKAAIESLQARKARRENLGIEGLSVPDPVPAPDPATTRPPIPAGETTDEIAEHTTYAAPNAQNAQSNLERLIREEPARRKAILSKFDEEQRKADVCTCGHTRSQHDTFYGTITGGYCIRCKSKCRAFKGATEMKKSDIEHYFCTKCNQNHDGTDVKLYNAHRKHDVVMDLDNKGLDIKPELKQPPSTFAQRMQLRRMTRKLPP